jgi:copper chaperone NosL
MKKRLLIIAGFLSIYFAGCSGNNHNAPPELTLGRDACDNCFMLINEKNFAASLWQKNGEAKRFDDIGCMLQYLKKNDVSTASVWVHDLNSGKPVQADRAFYAVSENLVTPMGFGIAAFEKNGSAQQYADQNKTKVITFNQLKSTKLITME